MHEVLAGYVERGELPGYVALVSRRGEVHVDCAGYERDTIFRIASMSKPVAAAAACILVEEARLRLDDPVDELLPELAHPKVLQSLDSPIDDTVPAKRHITVRDLLEFTLGMGVVFAMPGAYPIQDAIDKAGIHAGERRDRPVEDYLHALSALPLVHQPGDAWMYNVGSDLVGILVARASRQSFGEFLAERIFEPLGMRDTAFWVPESRVDRLPKAYTPTEEGLKLEDEGRGGQFSRPPKFESGAGGLVGTVDDWLAFAHMLMNGGTLGSTRILARPTVETMTSDRLTAEQKARSPWSAGYWENHGWGWGVGVVTHRFETSSTPGQYGWDGGFGSTWRSDPGEDLVAILMTQVGMTSPAGPPVFHDFLTLAYAALGD